MPPDWCATSSPVPDCAEYGRCDEGDRDLWPSSEDPNNTLTITLRFHIFGDVEEFATTPARIVTQVEMLNLHFNNANVQFINEPPIFITNYRFFHFCETQAPGNACICLDSCPDPQCASEELDMKTQYADTPAQKLNIYVVDLGTYAGYAGWGTFPWCSETKNILGGVIINGAHVGGEDECVDDGQLGDCTTLSHEIGHDLGLYHTQRGVTEACTVVNQLEGACSGCCESSSCEYAHATGICVTPECDFTGDYCCDTPPTDVNYECNDNTWDDFCMVPPGVFTNTDYTNHMGYAPSWCRTHFSNNQESRMACWSCDTLTGWMSDSTVGACCGSGEWCMDTTQTCCNLVGGTFKGGGSSCDAVGGCCLGFGSCIQTTVCDCAAQGGFFNAGWTCHPVAWCSFPFP